MKKCFFDHLEDAFQPIRSFLWFVMTRGAVLFILIWIIVAMVKLVLKTFPA